MIADAGMDERMCAEARLGRSVAKRQCLEDCPELAKCRAFILAAEIMPGAWGGVWGGLDAFDRRGEEVIVRVDGKARVRRVS